MSPARLSRRALAPAVLLLLLAAPVPGALSPLPLASAQETADAEGPRVTAYNFSALEVPRNGSVVLSFDVSDQTDVTYVGFWLKRNGTEHYVSGAFSPNASVPSGRYNLTVTWDPHAPGGHYAVASIYTYDSRNNWRSVTGADLPPGPAVTYADPANPGDLTPPTIGSLTFPSAVAKGENMTVRAVLADESPLREIQVSFRRDNGTQRVGGWLYNRSGFAPGEVALTVTWPTNALPGTYSLAYAYVVDVAGNHRYYDASEIPNGSRSVTYGDPNETVDGEAPALLHHSFGPGPYRAGDEMTVRFNASDASNVTWGGFAFRSSDGQDWLWVSYHPATPTPGGNHTFTHRFANGTAAGRYDLAYVFLADEWGNEGYTYPPYANGSSTNITLVDDEPVSKRPDLTPVQANTTPAAPREGDAVTVRALVRNNGTAPSGNATAALLVDGARVATAHLPALAAGGSTYVNLTWANATAGNHTMTVRADSTGAVNESDEGNNDLTFTRTVWKAALPDLALNLSVSNTTTYEGGRIDLRATVQNKGDAASPATLVRVSLDGIVVAERSVRALAPGESVVAYVNLTPAAGDRTLLVAADPDGAVQESSESNNRASVLLRVLPRPVVDLSVDIVEVRRPALETDFGSPGTSPHARRTVVIDVANAGPEGAANATVTLVAMGVGPDGATLVRHVETRNVTLPAGASARLEMTWSPLGHAGDVDLVARIAHPVARDTDASNDEDAHRDYVLVGGLDAGL